MLKAVRFSRFGGPEVLEILDLPDPHPGSGQVRVAVRAAGVNPSDWKKRKGLMDGELPQTMGHEAAGVVDELGEGVADVAVGDRVFGFSAEGAAQAELAVLSWYAPIPPSLDFPGRAVHALAQIGELIESGRFLVLLFPDGRLPSRRWRPVLWAMFVVLAGGVAGQLQAGTYISGGITNALSAANVRYPNPLGFLPRSGWLGDLTAVIFILALICGVLSVASVFVRRRGASAERRKQLAWLGYVGVMTVGWAAVLFLSSPFLPRGNSSIGTAIWSFLVLTPVAGIPLACVVAVLKYRLYEIDRLISRTVAYAIVTGLLVGVYARPTWTRSGRT